MTPRSAAAPSLGWSSWYGPALPPTACDEPDDAVSGAGFTRPRTIRDLLAQRDRLAVAAAARPARSGHRLLRSGGGLRGQQCARCECRLRGDDPRLCV